MGPTNRQELIDYCLRALGEPVIEVNVPTEQLEDRIDEAIQFYQEYHADAIEMQYVKHTLTQEEFDNNKISNLPEELVAITRVIAVQNTTNEPLFSVEYHMMDAIAHAKLGADTTDFFLINEAINNIKNMFRTELRISYVRHKDELVFHTSLSDSLKVGDTIVLETYMAVTPENYPDVFNDMGLKELATALIKRQWGQNLIKFEGMQLPGGVTLNGRQIFDDAKEEITMLKEQWRLTYEEPVDFFIG
jgi:hypothetical protein